MNASVLVSVLEVVLLILIYCGVRVFTRGRVTLSYVTVELVAIALIAAGCVAAYLLSK